MAGLQGSLSSIKQVCRRLWARMRPQPSLQRHPSPDQPAVLEAAFRQAVLAHRLGDRRLALLLAHQCDCLAGEAGLPGLELLLAELRHESPAAD